MRSGAHRFEEPVARPRDFIASPHCGHGVAAAPSGGSATASIRSCRAESIRGRNASFTSHSSCISSGAPSARASLAMSGEWVAAALVSGASTSEYLPYLVADV